MFRRGHQPHVTFGKALLLQFGNRAQNRDTGVFLDTADQNGLMALSGHPVREDLFDAAAESAMGHIELARWADLVLIAPATADCMARLAAGLADDLLTTTLLASKAPVLFVPAMNVNMWENPLYRQNQARLEEHGYHFMAPAVGALACGWEGQGKLPAPEDIKTAAKRRKPIRSSPNTAAGRPRNESPP